MCLGSTSVILSPKFSEASLPTESALPTQGSRAGGSSILPLGL